MTFCYIDATVQKFSLSRGPIFKTLCCFLQTHAPIICASQPQPRTDTVNPCSVFLQTAYGIMPIGARRFRTPTMAEVMHFEACHAAGPYSPINAQVPPWVPVWQYVSAEARADALRFART